MNFLRRLVATWQTASAAELEKLDARCVVMVLRVQPTTNLKKIADTAKLIGEAYPGLKGTPILVLGPGEEIEAWNHEQLRAVGLRRIKPEAE